MINCMRALMYLEIISIHPIALDIIKHPHKMLIYREKHENGKNVLVGKCRKIPLSAEYSAKLRATSALALYVVCVPHTLVPHMPRALSALVLYVPCVVRALVAHAPSPLRDFVPFVPRTLWALVHHVSRFLMLSCLMCLMLSCPTCLVSYVLLRPTCHLSYLSNVLPPPMPHVSHSMRVLVSHMSHAIRILITYVLRVLCALQPMCLRGL